MANKSQFQPAISDMDPELKKSKIKSIYKNLMVLSFSFMFIMTAFMSLQSLQSSLNREAGVGVISLSCLYGGALFSCMFAPVLIKKFGPKWCLSFGWLTQCIFTSANFYPKMYTLVPAGAILGIGTGLIWTSQGVYLTTIALEFASISRETGPSVMSRFNGIFFMIFQSTQIWGNLISSLILHTSGENDISPENFTEIVHLNQTDVTQLNQTYITQLDQIYVPQLNQTYVTHKEDSFQNEITRCGAKFCPFEQSTNGTAFTAPPKNIVYTLMGIFLSCGIAGTCLTVFFLSRLPQKSSREISEEEDLTLCERLSSTFQLLVKDVRMPLLAALCFYTGTEQALMYGDFTQSFIGCELGVGWVGYIMICLGVCNATFAFILGRLEKYTGRPALFVSATVINVALMLTMLMWTPDKQQMYVFFIIPALWGACDAVWQSQTSALLGVLFSSQKEAAFANFRLWQNLAQTIAFATSGLMCMSVKVIIAITLACISLALYIVVEVKEKMSGKMSSRRSTSAYSKPPEQGLVTIKQAGDY
ncbi:unnamed protein product [Owenia fusiformis]|uniref:Uncharacterized protein n=1 Tax=Owenia fusiformis TaxID=6347 RepID=A0A8J1U3N4_OWEFU|nr:unnamed protein product [Owenia fusiformis]